MHVLMPDSGGASPAGKQGAGVNPSSTRNAYNKRTVPEKLNMSRMSDVAGRPDNEKREIETGNQQGMGGGKRVNPTTTTTSQTVLRAQQKTNKQSGLFGQGTLLALVCFGVRLHRLAEAGVAKRGVGIEHLVNQGLVQSRFQEGLLHCGPADCKVRDAPLDKFDGQVHG